MQHKEHGEGSCFKSLPISTRTTKGQVSESDLTDRQTDGEGDRTLISAKGYSQFWGQQRGHGSVPTLPDAQSFEAGHTVTSSPRPPAPRPGSTGLTGRTTLQRRVLSERSSKTHLMTTLHLAQRVVRNLSLGARQMWLPSLAKWLTSHVTTGGEVTCFLYLQNEKTASAHKLTMRNRDAARKVFIQLSAWRTALRKMVTSVARSLLLTVLDTPLFPGNYSLSPTH